MKRFCFFSVAAVALTALMMTSCKKDEPSSPEPTPYTGELNYLVMWYAVGGGNLDYPQMDNIAQALSYGSTDKVKMTFQYKLSAGGGDFPKYQEEPAYSNFNGTRRFTLDQNVDLKGYLKETNPSLDSVQFSEIFGKINSIRIGDAQYMMSSDTALTSFINWSHKLYPNAKNVILVLGNHGGGWELLDDGKVDYDYKTKAIEQDDNTNNTVISLKAVERGISSSDIKKVKMIYTDACLMAVYENLVSYSKVADYALSAVEITPGMGGEYMRFLGYLNDATADAASLWDKSKEYIDYLNTVYWEKVSTYHDLGLYNLTQINSMTLPIKAITDSLVKKWNDETPISDTASLKLWKEFIRVAVTRCESFLYAPSDVSESKVPSVLIPYLDGVKRNKKNEYIGQSLVDWFGSMKPQEAIKAGYADSVQKLAEYMDFKTNDSYCIPDMLRQLNKSLKAAGVSDDKNPFIILRKNYLDALKSISYINCTKKNSTLASNTDYPYEFTGPGVFFYSLNAGAFGTETYYPQFGKKIELGDAINYYSTTDFDMTVKWSDFLKLVNARPSVLTNPRRANLK